MFTLSETMRHVQPSPTLELVKRANELRAEGKDIVAFTAGEPDFDTPEHVKQAAREALAVGFTKYTAAGGTPELKRVICDKFKRDQQLEFNPAEVIVSNGGKHALSQAFSVLLNPGDEVIIPSPYWTSYPDMVVLAGGKPVMVPTTAETNYLLTAEKLEQSLTDKTKIVIINSPSNPTGAAYSESNLKDFGKTLSSLANGERIVVVSDEVYEYITFDGFRHVSFATVAPELRNNTLVVNSFSKAYSMTGWRVGYTAGPKDIIAAMTKFQSQFSSSVCSISQYAAAHAFDDNCEFPQMLAREFSKRLNIVVDTVASMDGISLPRKPHGAFYAFLRIEDLLGKRSGSRTINSASDFSRYLLDDYNVIVVHGEAFGDPAAVRMSYAVSEEELKKGLQRIGEAVAELR